MSTCKPKKTDRLQLGLCRECGERPLVTKTTCEICKEKRKKRDDQRRQNRLKTGLCGMCGEKSGYKTCRKCTKYLDSRRHELLLVGKCYNCGVGNLVSKTRCQSCLDKQNATNNEIKLQVYKHYGSVCKCCGEKEIAFLSIDHVNNDGSTQRFTKHHPFGGINFYRWIIKNNYPSDLQLLCHNCQWGKRICGVCPHQRLTNLF